MFFGAFFAAAIMAATSERQENKDGFGALQDKLKEREPVSQDKWATMEYYSNIHFVV